MKRKLSLLLSIVMVLSVFSVWAVIPAFAADIEITIDGDFSDWDNVEKTTISADKLTAWNGTMTGYAFDVAFAADADTDTLYVYLDVTDPSANTVGNAQVCVVVNGKKNWVTIANNGTTSDLGATLKTDFSDGNREYELAIPMKDIYGDVTLPMDIRVLFAYINDDTSNVGTGAFCQVGNADFDNNVGCPVTINADGTYSYTLPTLPADPYETTAITTAGKYDSYTGSDSGFNTTSTVFGQKMTLDGTKLTLVNLDSAHFTQYDGDGVAEIKIYKWLGSLEATKAADPIYTGTQTDDGNNQWIIKFYIDESKATEVITGDIYYEFYATSKGEKLAVVTDSDNIPQFKMFLDGTLVTGGLKANHTVETYDPNAYKTTEITTAGEVIINKDGDDGWFNLKNSVGLKFTVGEGLTLTKVYFEDPLSHSGAEGTSIDFTLKVYAWKYNYAATKAAEPLWTGTNSVMKNGKTTFEIKGVELTGELYYELTPQEGYQLNLCGLKSGKASDAFIGFINGEKNQEEFSGHKGSITLGTEVIPDPDKTTVITTAGEYKSWVPDSDNNQCWLKTRFGAKVSLGDSMKLTSMHFDSAALEGATISVYEWKGNYKDTVAAKPLYTSTTQSETNRFTIPSNVILTGNLYYEVSGEGIRVVTDNEPIPEFSVFVDGTFNGTDHAGNPVRGLKGSITVEEYDPYPYQTTTITTTGDHKLYNGENDVCRFDAVNSLGQKFTVATDFRVSSIAFGKIAIDGSDTANATLKVYKWNEEGYAATVAGGALITKNVTIKNGEGIEAVKIDDNDALTGELYMEVTADKPIKPADVADAENSVSFANGEIIEGGLPGEITVSYPKYVRDEKWNNTEAIKVNTGSASTTANAYLMWDDTYVYVLVEVNDATINENDYIELRLDLLHDKNSQYFNQGWGADGGKYRGDIMCEAGFMVKAGRSGFGAGVGDVCTNEWWSNQLSGSASSQIVSNRTETGYYVEFKLKAVYDNVGKCMPKENQIIGLGVAVYDNVPDLNANKTTLNTPSMLSEVVLAKGGVSYTPRIEEANVSLGESIGLNVYANVKGTMEFTMNGITKPVEGVEVDGQYKYTFNVTPQCMGDEISIVLKEAKLELGYVIDTRTTTIKALLEATVAANPEDAELAQLVADLLNYGAKAQLDRDYNTDALVSDGEGASDFDALEAPTSVKDLIGEVDGITVKAAGVRFDYGVNKVYFKVTGDLAGKSVQINGADAVVVDGVIYSAGLSALEFDKVITLTIDDTDVATYSVNSYVATMAEVEGTAGDLARALYAYGVSAQAYAN